MFRVQASSASGRCCEYLTVVRTRQHNSTPHIQRNAWHRTFSTSAWRTTYTCRASRGLHLGMQRRTRGGLFRSDNVRTPNGRPRSLRRGTAMWRGTTPGTGESCACHVQSSSASERCNVQQHAVITQRAARNAPPRSTAERRARARARGIAVQQTLPHCVALHGPPP
jgi:hypothetical protein